MIGLTQLAGLYIDTNQFEKAESPLVRALKIGEKFGKNDPDVGHTASVLGCVYWFTHRYEQAIPLLQRAINIRVAEKQGEDPYVIPVVQCLGNVYAETGKPERAESSFRRGLRTNLDRLGPDHYSLADSINNLALLHLDAGKTADAVEEIDCALFLLRNDNVRRQSMMSPAVQLAATKSDENMLHLALTIALRNSGDPELAQKAAGWLANHKSSLTYFLLDQKRLQRDTKIPAAAEVSERLQDVRRGLVDLQVTPDYAKRQERLDQLKEHYAQEQTLRTQWNELSGISMPAEPWVEIETIRKKLPPDAVLIDLVRFRPTILGKMATPWADPAHYVAWIVPAQDKGDVMLIDLGEADPIEQAIREFQAALNETRAETAKNAGKNAASGSERLQPSLTKLSKLLLTPMAPTLDKYKQLILSPNQELWLVPWAALPLENGTYAIEKWQQRYVIAGRDLLTTVGKPVPTNAPVIFADPDYDIDAKSRKSAIVEVAPDSAAELAARLRDAPFDKAPNATRLAGGKDFVKAITPHLQKYSGHEPFVCQDRKAQEGLLKILSHPKALVVATRTFYRPSPAQVLEKHRWYVGDTDFTTVTQENPLNRCGLFLAGSNNRAGVTEMQLDDGILLGHEVPSIDLRGTELVVLPFCDALAGPPGCGAAVGNLQQAFQIAGAHAVVSTLWQPPASEAALFVNVFFDRLAKGGSKAEALRETQLAMI